MFISGAITLGAANTPQRLVSATDTSGARRITNVVIATNGTIAVGDNAVVAGPAAAVVGVPVVSGAPMAFSASDLTDVWVAGASGGERVSWSAKAI
jgi:phosphoribosylcarboxyaminoimidazole (NCAIR) mutase